jgi:C4-dicarboxylate-specific signal transduction histidine kinase
MERLHVLVVEDDTVQRQLVTRAVTLAKFAVTACSGISEALAVLNGQTFPVAIVDLGLLEEDGLELVRELVRRKSKTKVILHTAKADFESAQIGIELGVFAYVQKSSGIANLMSAVERAASEYLVNSLSSANEEIQFQVRLLDSLQEGAIAINSKFEIIFANRSAQRALGIAETDILGCNILLLLNQLSPDSASSIAELQRVCDKLQHAVNCQIEINIEISETCAESSTPTRCNHTFRLTVSPIGDTPESFAGFIFVLTDISVQKRAEMEMSKSRQIANHAQRVATIGQMAGILAHEINQPLGAISNYVGGLLLGLKSSNLSIEEFRETLLLIQNQALRASDIVDHTRNYVSRTGQTSVAVDINQLIRDCIQLLEFELREHRTQIRLQLAEEPLLVHGDRIQLSQVLVNILKNAAEAIDSVDTADRQCTITTSQSDFGINIEFRDYGPGVPPNKLETIDDPFTTSKAGGLGVGLSICKTIVEDHGGHITLENAEPKGFRVLLHLPRSSNPAE